MRVLGNEYGNFWGKAPFPFPSPAYRLMVAFCVPVVFPFPFQSMVEDPEGSTNTEPSAEGASACW